MRSVSTVITSYNSKQFIEQALTSCAEQKFKASQQIIVVDDCSTDGTWELLKELSRQYNFELIQTKSNSGPSAARNLGISLAQGEYIGFLDGDDYLLPTKLAKQVKVLKDNPQSVGVFCDSKIEKKDGVSSITLKQVSAVATTNEDFLAHLLKTNCIALHAALIKTAAAKKILFDESLRRAEDYDFWLRLVIENGGLLYLDDPLVVYRKVKGGLSSQIIKTIDDNVAVLDKINLKSLSVDQKTNLNQQKSGLLRTAAHLRLRKFNSEGLNYLERAANIGSLPRSQQLVLNISRKNKLAALLMYSALSFVLYIKRISSYFTERSRIVKEFNR